MISKQEKGFTLIELLVVIAIIGILSSVVLASLSSTRVKAADTAVKVNMDAIRKQGDVYYLANGTYGANVTDCTTGVFSDTVVANAQAQTLSNSQVGAVLSCATDASGLKFAISDNSLRGGGSWCIDSVSARAAGMSAQTSGINQGTCQ